MEFSSTQLTILNHLLPIRFKLELLTKTNSSQSLKPMSKPQNFIPNLPAKRSSSELLELIPKKLSESSSKMLKIITELKNHEKYPLFSKNFHQNCSNPVSIPIIEANLLQGKYKQASDFTLEVRQVWNFSFSQNVGRQDLYSATVDLSHFFETQMSEYEKILNKPTSEASQSRKVHQNSEIIQNTQNSSSLHASRTQNSNSKQHIRTDTLSKPPERVERAMGFMEKRNLCQNIRKLEPKYFTGIFDIVKDYQNFQGQEVEIDLETLPAKVARELDRYVKLCLSKCSKGRKNTVEQIKTAQSQTNLKLAQLGNENSKITAEKSSEETLLKESSSESSSTSESEEELPESLVVNSSCSLG